MKNVKMTRSYGDILIRTGGRYKATGIKTKNIVSVEVPDNEADLYKRIGAYGKESGMKAYIARAFDADGESLVELITASVSNLDILKAIIMLTGMAQ